MANIRDVSRERRMEKESATTPGAGGDQRYRQCREPELTIEDVFGGGGEARRLVPFDRLTIALLDDAESGLEVVSVVGGAGPRRVPLGNTEAAWGFRRPFAWCETAKEARPLHLEDLLPGPVRSVMVLPLLSKDRLVGSLNLGRAAPDAFCPADLAVLEPVARHVAIARNARRIEDVRRRSASSVLL